MMKGNGSMKGKKFGRAVFILLISIPLLTLCGIPACAESSHLPANALKSDPIISPIINPEMVLCLSLLILAVMAIIFIKLFKRKK